MTTKKLTSIYDVKFNDSKAFYWFDENCLRVTNKDFFTMFPKSEVTDVELDFFRDEFLMNGFN
jgi:hypothetical protein